MELRDVIHGSIGVDRSELGVVDSRFFQRLRQIKQLGFGEYSYPNATHNRYMHSLGAMQTATRMFQTIFGGEEPSLRLSRESYTRFRTVVRLAALLHDIGHGPLSHTTEFAMPEVSKLKLPFAVNKDRQANHEDYTLKIILDSSLTPALERIGKDQGFLPCHVAALIDPNVELPADAKQFFFDQISGEKTDFRPILHQLISSELDADRMDYLQRDSIHAGVTYGQFDFDWLVSNLTFHLQQGRCFLALQHRGIYSFEDFLISRFHMFLMVYFHYKSVVYDEMLAQYLSSPGCEYSLPADIEKYCDCNDAQLYSHLTQSSNEWAKRIADKRAYRMLIELHSGIPATKTATSEQKALLTKIEKDLKNQGIHFLRATSTGELSKYFRKPADPIFIRYDNHYNAPNFIPLEQCTDLFQRYSEKRSITRLYVTPERFADCRLQGRDAPLRYEPEAT